MRALTLMTRQDALAYLSGVIRGDGWLTKELGLRCADRDFAQAAADALAVGFAVQCTPKTDERGYWLIRLGNASGRFNLLRDIAANSASERAAWLRGLFDSEGNAQLTPHPRIGPNSFGRRIAMYSTSIATLDIATGHLEVLGVRSRTRATKNSAGHKGALTVYELSLVGNRDNYARFAALVSSNISRKRVAMRRVVQTYQPDLSACRRASQLLGAAAKTARTKSIVIPEVIANMRAMIERGDRVTCRACADINGYWAARGHLSHGQLVTAARNLQ